MAGNPPGPPQPQRQTNLSPDGFWYWDGAQWRSVMSPDGLWRWNGREWLPARPAAPARGAGGTVGAVVVTVLAFGGVIVLVSVLVIVILLAMGNQLANVFSNVVAALGATPSP